MATKRLSNIFSKFFREIYYRILSLDPKHSYKFENKDGRIFIDCEYSDFDCENLLRFMKGLGIDSGDVANNLYRNKKSSRYCYLLKLVVLIGTGDDITGACIDAFNSNYRYLSKDSVESIANNDSFEEYLKSFGYNYLCIPHLVSPLLSEVTIIELDGPISISYLLNSKKDKDFMSYNLKNNTGLVFRVL